LGLRKKILAFLILKKGEIKWKGNQGKNSLITFWLKDPCEKNLPQKGK